MNTENQIIAINTETMKISVHKNISVAARTLNLNRSNISTSMNSSSRGKYVNRYAFIKLEKENPLTMENISKSMLTYKAAQALSFNDFVRWNKENN